MLKKMVVGSVVASLAAGFLFGSDMFSYANTACDNVRNAVKSEITPEFELDRIRGEIDELMPEIRQHMTIVAEQSVDIKDLQRGIDKKSANLNSQKDAIIALRSDLSGQSSSFTYRQVSYTRGEVEADLAERFDSFRRGEDAVQRDRQILSAQRQTLRANQQRLDSMLTRKQDLALHVSQLEARLKTIQASEAVNNIEVDDTKLARVENMIKDLNHNLDVRESLLETEGSLLGRIPVEEDVVEQNTDVVSAIDEHFGLSTDEHAAEAATSDSI